MRILGGLAGTRHPAFSQAHGWSPPLHVLSPQTHAGRNASGGSSPKAAQKSQTRSKTRGNRACSFSNSSQRAAGSHGCCQKEHRQTLCLVPWKPCLNAVWIIKNKRVWPLRDWKDFNHTVSADGPVAWVCTGGGRVLPLDYHFTSLGNCRLIFELACFPQFLSGRAASTVELQQGVRVHGGEGQGDERGKLRLVKMTLENSLWRHNAGIQHGCFSLQCQNTLLFLLLHTRGRRQLAVRPRYWTHTRASTHGFYISGRLATGRMWEVIFMWEKQIHSSHFLSDSLGHRLSPSGVTSKTSLTMEKIISPKE